MQLAIAGRNASIDAVNTLLNGGTLEIRTGAPAAIDVTATAAGVAGHYVAKDLGGNAERNGTVGVEMTLNNTTFGIGDDVSVTGWTYAQGTS